MGKKSKIQKVIEKIENDIKELETQIALKKSTIEELKVEDGR